MPNNLTNYGEGLVGQHLFRTGVWTKPTTVHVALLTSASDAEVGTLSEVSTSGTGYGRQAVACADANWTPPSGGNKRFANALPITFPGPTGAWGTVTHFALYDEATGGNPLVVAPLTTPRTIAGGDAAPVFAAGALRVTFSGGWTDYLVGRIGDHLLRTTMFAKPTTLAVAIFVGGSELSGSGYARASCNPSDANWTAPSSGNGQFANAVAITWPTPSAPWGVMSDVVLYDATSGGNEWCRVTGMSYAMSADAPTTLTPGALVVTLG